MKVKLVSLTCGCCGGYAFTVQKVRERVNEPGTLELELDVEENANALVLRLEYEPELVM
jgi:predicted nucleotide-binding protein (sugar kinase/HSP70/actin superfamily)